MPDFLKNKADSYYEQGNSLIELAVGLSLLLVLFAGFWVIFATINIQQAVFSSAYAIARMNKQSPFKTCDSLELSGCNVYGVKYMYGDEMPISSDSEADELFLNTLRQQFNSLLATSSSLVTHTTDLICNMRLAYIKLKTDDPSDKLNGTVADDNPILVGSTTEALFPTSTVANKVDQLIQSTFNEFVTHFYSKKIKLAYPAGLIQVSPSANLEIVYPQWAPFLVWGCVKPQSPSLFFGEYFNFGENKWSGIQPING